MVMGFLGRGGGGGQPGPPGPPGPPGQDGQPGPPGTDVAGTALAVFARATLVPQDLAGLGDWTTLVFTQTDQDTHGSLSSFGAFVAPIAGTYHLQASIRVTTPPGGTISLRVLRGTTPWAQRTLTISGPPPTALTVEIAALVTLPPGEVISLQIRSSSPLPLQIANDLPSSSLMVAGVGVAQ